jgi:hypothetical protein
MSSKTVVNRITRSTMLSFNFLLDLILHIVLTTTSNCFHMITLQLTCSITMNDLTARTSRLKNALGMIPLYLLEDFDWSSSPMRKFVLGKMLVLIGPAAGSV